MSRIEKNKKSHGGYRPGAGRKKEKDRVVLFQPIELAEKINALPDKNAVAQQLFEQYFRKEQGLSDWDS